MNNEMTDDEIRAASLALIDWLESQEIIRHDAVRVLATTMIAIIKEIAVSHGLDPREGGRIICDTIVKSLS